MDYYRKSDGVTKKKILGCIFAEKLDILLRAEGPHSHSHSDLVLQTIKSCNQLAEYFISNKKKP